MNALLEKQVNEYLEKSVTDLPPDLAALLTAINEYYNTCDEKMAVCQREKTEMTGALEKDRVEISRREVHLSASQRIAKVGSWELDLENLDNLNANPLFWSDETFRIMGFTPGEVAVSNDLFFSRVHPDDRAMVLEATSRAVQTSKTYDIEHRLLLPGGLAKTVHERSDIVFDDDGKPLKMIGTIQDITAIKTAQQQLEKTNYELQTLFENMQEGFFSLDTEANRLLQISKACESIWGYSDDEFMKNPDLWFEIILEEDKPVILANYPLMQAGRAFSQQYRIRHKDGSTKWLESKITPTLNNDGKLVRVDGMTSDITARKDAEKKAAESELLNRIFFEQNLAGVYRTTPDGRILTCNDAFVAMLGYTSQQEVLKLNATALYFNTEERDRYIAELQQQHKLENYNLILKQKDGSPLHVIESISLITDPVTGDEFCDGIMVNITSHKKAEGEFYNREKRYRQIVETAQEGIWTIDENNKTNFVNKKICEILEYSPEEMMGKELYDFMDDEGVEYAIACMERRKKGARENLDIRYVTKSGRDVWANISANPIFDTDGSYKGSLAMVTDITERKYKEELLKKSETNLRTIFDHTDAAFILLDEKMRLVSFNAVAQKIMHDQDGTGLAEGNHVLNCFAVKRQPAIQNIISRVMAGETIAYEAAVKQADGSSRWLDVKWASITNDDKEICGIILTSVDITDKKIVTLEHERITAELVQRNKDLQQFNYIVSHNLRAPVANILGLSTLLSSHQNDADHKEQLLAGLSTSTKNLDEIIQDLNYILQVREEGVHEKKESIYLPRLVEDIKLSISNIIVKEKVVLNCYFEEFDTIITIRSYLHSIFYNLILNSIKYRQPAVDPVINIRSVRHKNMAELFFEDNGKGIDIKRNGKDLFGLYKRFDNIVEGKGIGLFMVKTQVENLNGKISVQSKVNKGTTFKLELPL